MKKQIKIEKKIHPHNLKNYNGNKFYNGRPLWAAGAPWNVVLSERANGKSLWYAKECILDFLDNGHRIAYVRRYEDQLKNKDVTLYFSDPNLLSWLQAGSEYTSVKCIRGELWLMGPGSDGKEEQKELLGWAFALNVQEKYKSLHYENVYNIIFEEFITNKFYLANEYMEFNHLISTLCRSGVYRAILLGNTISRDCPYLLEMGVDIFTVERGKMYETAMKKEDGSEIKCIFDFAAPAAKTTFFFGKAEKNIVSGEWDVEEQPHIFFKLQDAEVIYKCIMITKLHQAFKLCVVLYNDQKYLFVYPGKYKEVSDSFGDIFTDTANFQNGYFLKPEKKRHEKVWPLIRMKRVLYSDNLTGTEFNRALKRYNPFIV